MQILQIALAKPLRHLLDYLPPTGIDPHSLIPGVRVTVPFRNKPVTGIFMGINPDSNVKTSKMKHCLEVLDTDPVLTPQLIKILKWASQYYHHPIGEVIMNALPTWLRQGKSTALKITNNIEKKSKKASKKNQNKMSDASQAINDPLLAFATDTNIDMTLLANSAHHSSIQLNAAQLEAVKTIEKSFGHFTTFLLEGVTGSGKTEVYFELIQHLIEQGKQILLLVPEIGLTPQLVARFESRFTAPMAVLHSKLTPRQRFHAWQMAANGQASIVIGTRSAIFTPIPHLGLIIIDEEHDSSFKQQDNFRYSARDIAIMRSQLESIPIVLGSATPSLESLYNVKKERYQCLQLPQRAGNAVLPHFHIIDIRKQMLQEGLSLTLIEQIRRHLQQGGQTLLFLNRRGFAPTILCHNCGHVATCRHCDAHYTLHYEPYLLQCHHCGMTHSVLKECPDCKATNLIPLGVGTERLEQALTSHFPDAQIIRIDRDTTRRKGSLQHLLTQIHNKEKKQQILIGTQMLTKGHHFPDVSLVGIINADSGLLSADFRASERIAQMLIQVAGRAGRAERPGEVYIQTHHPEHPLLMHLIKEGYPGFAEAALEERRLAILPPNAYFALLRAEANTQKLPIAFLEEIRSECQRILKPQQEVSLLGPIPAPMERKAGFYRAQLLFQATKRSALQAALPKVLTFVESHHTARKVRWSLDVDPIELY